MFEVLLSVFCGTCSHAEEGRFNSVHVSFACFKNVSIISVDILVLVMILIFFILGLFSKRIENSLNSHGLLPVQITSAIYNVVLGLVQLGLGLWILGEKIGAKKTVLPLYEWLVVLFQGFTWMLLSFTVSFKLQQLQHTIIMKLGSILAFLLSMFLCITSVWEAIRQETTSVKMVLDILSFPGAILLLFCAFWGPKYTNYNQDVNSHTLYAPLRDEDINTSGECSNEDDNEEGLVTPFAYAGLLSKMTFWWLNPLILKRKKKILEEKDVPQLCLADRAKTRYSLFIGELNNRENNRSSEHPSIIRSIISCHWKSILFSGFLALIKVITISSGPLFLKAFISVAEGETIFRYEVYALALGLFLVKCIESLAGRHWYFQSRLIGLQVRSSLCAAIYNKQLRLSNAAKVEHTSGDIVNYVTVDAYRVGEFPYWFHQIWSTILQLCISLVIVYYCVGLATIATIIVLILTVFGNSPIGKLQHKYQANFMIAQNQRLKVITEALVNMKVLKLYAWESYFKNVIERLRSEEYKWLTALQLQKGYYLVLFWSTSVLIGAATLVTCYFLGISLNSSNVFTFLAILRIIQGPIRSLPDVLGVFIEAKVSVDRIANFLEAPELKNSNIRQIINETELKPSVLINSADLSWASDLLKPTLRNINLEIKPGEKVAICGEVGAGKSTLLAAILGELPSMEGSIKVYGTVAYVSQTAWIQTGTIQENVLFGTAMDHCRYHQVLEKCSLVKDLEMLPFGDLTQIGERGVNLSGGQKQRIQLARALYQDRDIYLLDDPFSALDAQTAKSVFTEYVMGALSGKTVLLVTHQVDFLPAFDSVLLLYEGEITHAAKYDQLLATSKEFQNLVNAHKDTMGEETLLELAPSKHNKHYDGEIKNINYEEQSNAAVGDQLIKEEERETGDIGLKPYRDYLSHNKGLLYFSLSNLAHLMFLVAQILQSWWLASYIKEGSTKTLKLVIVYSGIGVVMIIFLLIRSYLVAYLSLEASESIFDKLLTSLFRAPMAFYDSTPVGRILSRVSSDLSIVDLDLGFKVPLAVGSAMTAISTFIVLCALSWQVLIVVIPVVYLIILLQNYYFAVAKELIRINGTRNSLLASHLAESIAGAVTIRAFVDEERFFAKNLDLIDENSTSSFHSFTAKEWLIQRLETLSAIVIATSALFTTLLHQGYAGSGYVGMALSFGLTVNEFLVYSASEQCVVADLIVSVERLNQYIHIPSEAPEEIEENRPPPNWPATGKVEINDLQIRYRPNAPLVLRGITCTFEGGHKIGIVGRTGSGKTTLISALFRLVEPTGGNIIIDGLDITSIGLHDLRSNLGIIPQDPTLFSGSLRYNLDPLSQFTDQEIWEVLEKCHLREVIQEKQEGLNSLVVQDGTNWSVGQRQLIGLGRVLLKRCQILALDEATASIDNATDSALQKTIRAEFVNCTVITVAHRIPTVMDCTMVLAISDGEIVEYDEPMKLLQREHSLFGQLVKEYWSHAANKDSAL
ncbi:hypothetical protein Patl1_17586 [Pistacia atlantica]|uniref:Uncharacterized protein n=1 Tax=Pistacia atlantica TaxID=434234 RepID=A0ACC1C2K7_9ROSI|nr:hypothetical protein Patl1_17586 [Pistacia atlantica]